MRERAVPRALIVLLTGAAAIVILAGIKAVGSIVGPLVLALVLTVAVDPIRDRLARRGAPRWLVVAVPFTVVMVVLFAMVGVLTVAVAQLAALVPNYGPQFDRLTQDMQRLAAEFGVAPELGRVIQSLDPGNILTFAQALLASLIGVLSGLLLIVILLLAMSLDAPIVSRVLDAAAAERPAFVAALGTFAHRVRRYLLVSTIFGIICSALDVAALYVLGVPLPLLWGVLALITNYIPNIGFVIGLVPPALLALLTGGVRSMLLVIVAYMVINVVVQSFIQPKFLGDAVGLTTTVTLLSLIVWATVLGPLGALLAIPLTLLTRALLIDSDPAAKWSGALVSGEIPKAREPSAPDG